MSLTVSSTTSTQGIGFPTTVPVNTTEVDEPLFNPELDEVEINALALQLANLEADLAKLEQLLQDKVDYKKELEQQRAAILKQKAQIEAQI